MILLTRDADRSGRLAPPVPLPLSSHAKHVVPVIEPQGWPDRLDHAAWPSMSLAGCRGPKGSSMIVVRQENEVPNAFWNGNMRKSFTAECGPDRHVEQGHCSERSLDPFGETEEAPRPGKPNGTL